MAKLASFLVLALIAISMVVTTVLATDFHHLSRQLYGKGNLRSYQCAPECTRRCSQTQYKKPCLFFCNKCCNTCLCVPNGYYGNKDLCPCYNNWKTKKGGPKCP